MGLSTTIYLLDAIDRHEVFAFANSLMDNDAPDVIEDTENIENGVVTLTNRHGRILPAWLTAEFRDHIPLHSKDSYEEGFLVAPECWGSIRFDTNWDYQDTHGGALELHAKFIVEFYQWLTTKGLTMKWRDCEDSEPNDGMNGLEDFFSRGDKKLKWFNEQVLPKYEAMFMKTPSR